MSQYISDSLAGPRRQQDKASLVISEVPLLLRVANVSNKLEFLKFIQEQNEQPAFSHRNNAEPFNESLTWRATKVCNDNQLIAALAVFTTFCPLLHRTWWEFGDLVQEVNRIVNELPKDLAAPFDVAQIHYDSSVRGMLVEYLSRPGVALKL